MASASSWRSHLLDWCGEPRPDSYALIAFALLAAGAVVSLGIRREEAAGTLTVSAPGRAARGARSATRAYARLPGVMQKSSLHPQDFLLSGHGTSG
jgi:hypothetical protein